MPVTKKRTRETPARQQERYEKRRALIDAKNVEVIVSLTGQQVCHGDRNVLYTEWQVDTALKDLQSKHVAAADSSKQQSDANASNSSSSASRPWWRTDSTISGVVDDGAKEYTDNSGRRFPATG